MQTHSEHRNQKHNGLRSVSIAEGEKMALNLFHEAAVRVPAYKDFLQKHGVRHERIATYQDFERHVPLMNKKNYISQYSLAELSMDGNQFANRIISVSSGSSGEPFFWPRGQAQDSEGTAMFGEIYDAIFDMDQKSTLLVVCFSMGTWIAGTFTMSSALGYIDQGRPVHVITPGLEKEETISAVKRLAKNYEQVVLVGYPPFVKDVIDEGIHAGIDWKAAHTRLLLASESFSEEWRDYVLNLLGSKDPLFGSSSIYGSADVGILGIETPLSVTARRIYSADAALRQEVFGSEILPSFVQYDPSRRHFEVVDDGLVFTANAGLPLIRYDIGDSGGVLSFDEVIGRERIRAEAAEQGVKPEEWERPFVYVHGRKFFAVTIYGVKIYPEYIKAGLLNEQVRDFVTGKFTMATKNYSDMDQYFEINVELARGESAGPGRTAQVKKAIIQELMVQSAEFHKLHDVIRSRAEPHIHLLPFGDPDYFKGGSKHKWVKP